MTESHEATQPAIREARPEDAATVLAVLKAAFGVYRGRLDPPSGAERETVETVRAKLSEARCAVAEIGGAVRGCVFYERRPDHVYFFRLAVLPACQRAGVGKALIDHVEARAGELGCPRVRLSVRLALPRQRAYYERLGYRLLEYGVHPGYSAPTFATLEKDVGG